jgi:hypothetical protein
VQQRPEDSLEERRQVIGHFQLQSKKQTVNKASNLSAIRHSFIFIALVLESLFLSTKKFNHH